MAIQSVIVVGAGPSGLLLAVLLGKKGIHVQILEAASQLDDRPRATHYAPPATYELRRAGILEKMKARGAFIPTGVCWRKLNGEYIAGIDAPGANDPSEENPLICLSLDKLSALLKEELDTLPNVELLLGHTVTDIGQDEIKAWVDVRINDSASTKRFEAQYIVGCDGANSQVRRSLFGDWEFPGFTWNEQIVATNACFSSPFKTILSWKAMPFKYVTIRLTDLKYRLIIPLKSTDSTEIPISSSIPSTGLWQHGYQTMVSGG
jgi:2-polyprenyl-6-methoxyphenol hydroxylase-like FAD-dependent oxidoreductase